MELLQYPAGLRVGAPYMNVRSITGVGLTFEWSGSFLYEKILLIVWDDLIGHVRLINLEQPSSHDSIYIGQIVRHEIQKIGTDDTVMLQIAPISGVIDENIINLFANIANYQNSMLTCEVGLYLPESEASSEPHREIQATNGHNGHVSRGMLNKFVKSLKTTAVDLKLAGLLEILPIVDSTRGSRTNNKLETQISSEERKNGHVSTLALDIKLKQFFQTRLREKALSIKEPENPTENTKPLASKKKIRNAPQVKTSTSASKKKISRIISNRRKRIRSLLGL